MCLVDELWDNPLDTCIFHLLLQLIEVAMRMVDVSVCLDSFSSVIAIVTALAGIAIVQMLERESDDGLLERSEACHEGSGIGDTSVDLIQLLVVKVEEASHVLDPGDINLETLSVDKLIFSLVSTAVELGREGKNV